ncbi:MAG: Hsp20/alpha crystallin family protein [Candidatus Hodarchaeales archaeon]
MQPEEFGEDIDIEIEEEELEDFPHPPPPHERHHRIMIKRPPFGPPEDFFGPMDPGKKVMIKRIGKHRSKKTKCIMINFYDEDDIKGMMVTIPGLDKDTLSVKAKKRAVLIEGSYLKEYQKFFGEKIDRKVRLPFDINPDKINANYTAGVLKLEFLGIEDPTVEIPVVSDED